MQAQSVRRLMSAWMVTALLGSLPASLAAQESRTQAGAKRPRDAVHLVSAVRPQDPKLTEMLDEAAASLNAGDEVVILFDGQSAGSLRMSVRREKKTPLEAAEFAGPERQALAERLGVPYSAAPRNHLEYIQHLAQAGAKVFVNRDAIRLYGLAEEEIHPVATPISLRQMAELLDESDLCYTYGTR